MELSAFDLDKTLVEGNTSAIFCRYLHKRGVISLPIVFHCLIYGLRHRFFGMTLAELHHSAFNRLLLGRSIQSLEEHIEEFVKEVVEKRLYMPAFNHLKRAQEKGHYTMILSNSPSFLVEHFASFLGVNAFKATEYAVDENLRFAKVKKILEGKDKAVYLQKIAKKLGVFLEQINVYSDSILDLEFLEAGGNKIAVNPDDNLRSVAIENQWSII